MKSKTNLNRRKFITQTAASGIGLTIVPSFVIAGSGKTPPSDKINVGLIGSGTVGLRITERLLSQDQLQFVSVCDPNKESHDYPTWGKSQNETKGVSGGREVGKKMIQEFYAGKNNKGKYKAVSTYADFREQFDRESGLDAVVNFTPDHIHGPVIQKALEKKLSIGTHKPIANFMNEIRRVCTTAKAANVPTHCFAFQDPDEIYTVKSWIDNGLIGEVKELHRWTNRAVWPQGSPYLPEPEPIPEGFDWQLWLGPATDRPYSPKYTHTVFRGWYEFGAGCLADMGYYGFWKDWRILNLGTAAMAEASKSHTCEIKDFRSHPVHNIHGYPHAARVMWEIPVNGMEKSIDVHWYEGGIKPNRTKDMRTSGVNYSHAGVMIIGEKGRIVAGDDYQDPVIIGLKNAEQEIAQLDNPVKERLDTNAEMIRAFKGGEKSRGDLTNVQEVAETIGIGNLAIRANGYIDWDSENLVVKNNEKANAFVRREYRKGWEL